MTAKRIEISAEKAHELLDRAKKALAGEDYQIIKGLIDTHLLLLEALAQKNTSIKKLRKMIFGAKTEKTGSLRPKKTTGGSEKKTKGHGKNGAADYAGEHVAVNHQALQHCGPCPACVEGRLYRQSVPGVIVRITGAAPLAATIYELEKAALQHLRQGIHRRFTGPGRIAKIRRDGRRDTCPSAVWQRFSLESYRQAPDRNGNASCPLDRMGGHREDGRPDSSRLHRTHQAGSPGRRHP